MKRRILTLILAIVMLSGVALIATANPPTNVPRNTDGSIEFKTGAIIINPPPSPPPSDCFCCPICHPAGDPSCTCSPPVVDPRCPCPCTCADKDDYDKFFMEHRVADNLYFGEHELTVYGTFDSANKQANAANLPRYTTRRGEYTGVEIINQTPGIAGISVAIGHFRVGAEQTLTGFELSLRPEAAILRDGSEPSGGVPIQKGEDFRGDAGFPVVLKANDTAIRILTVGSAREVRAAWYGLFDIEIDTPRHPGLAQATLTWTGENVP